MYYNITIFINYCIIFNKNNCKPTFAQPCISQTHQNMPGRMSFTCHFSKNKVITSWMSNFIKIYCPCLGKSDTDDNSYHLLSSSHGPGPMLRPVHALVILILTTVPWWINNANSYQVTYLGTSSVRSQTRFF
uniref:Uncharacterized protein n=1 Tax=Pipistrellus kuhlii TaxID=59472 RepID=A0A7J7W3H7_PIPKU|nr:hypothetical protein mPipKuh1_008152 [Pipistrellus kuhlii]